MENVMDYWEPKIAKMYRTVFLMSISLLFLCCNKKQRESLTLPYYNEPDFTPIFVIDQSMVMKDITHRISDFSFLNQDSIMVTQKEIEGKIHVANFMFTGCGSICPVMTNHMKMISDSLNSDRNLVLLSYSVTPWIDKSHILKKYKAENNIQNKNWHFLTGNKADIYKLARQSYFAEEDLGFSKDSTEFLHTEHFILVDKTKRIRGVYNGTLALEMHQLIGDIKTLEQEDHL
jgi:protein SCO1/2